MERMDPPLRCRNTRGSDTASQLTSFPKWRIFFAVVSYIIDDLNSYNNLLLRPVGITQTVG
jgi:hypothetical protein